MPLGHFPLFEVPYDLDRKTEMRRVPWSLLRGHALPMRYIQQYRGKERESGNKLTGCLVGGIQEGEKQLNHYFP